MDFKSALREELEKKEKGIKSILDEEIEKAKGKTIKKREVGAPKKTDEKISRNPIAGTAASVRAGAVEGTKNTINNAKTWHEINENKKVLTNIENARERARKAGIYNDKLEEEFTSEVERKREKIEQLIAAQKEKNAISNANLQAVNDRYELGRVGEFAQELGGTLGNTAPSLAVGLINPAAGVGLTAAQAAAQGYGQALDDGATHEQAALYGAGIGALEAGVERLTGGLSRFYGKGLLLNPVKNSSVKNVILNTAKGAAGEGAEEAIQGFADPFLQRATYDPDAPNATPEELAHQAAIGAALGGILGGGSNVVDYRAGKKAAERTQDGAGWAQGERTTIDTQAQDVGLNGDVENRRTAENVMNDVNPPKTPYEQAYDDMLKGEDSTKPKADPEDERRVKNFIQSAAVRARMQVEYVDRPLSQKAYYSDGKIYINKNRPFDDTMKITVAHELYHGMEGTKEHDAIVKLAFEGKDADAMIAEKINSYRERGIELDETGARAEIGADFIERAMTDEATINQVLLENRTLAGKIVERIKEIIDIYRAKKSMSADEAQEYAALLKAKRLYEDGLEKLHEGEYSPAGVERSARYQAIKRTDDGRNYVEIEEDILQGVPKKQWSKVAMQNLAKKFPNGVQIGNNLIKINAVSRNELQNSKYTQQLRKDKISDKYHDKMSITNNADELLQSNRDYVNEDLKHERNDNIKDFGRGKILFKVGDNTYSADMVVGNKADGSMVLYDIVNMQPEKFNEKKDSVSEDYSSSDADTTVSNGRVTNPAENVNSKSQKNEKRFALDESYQEDNTGAKLSKQQQEYFKDSKIRDKDGRLLRVYHGTSLAFTEFDRDYLGSSSGHGSGTNAGFFFAADMDHAEYWAENSKYATGNPQKVMELYLNIKEPIIIDEAVYNDGGLTMERLLEDAYYTGDYDGAVIQNMYDDESGYPRTAYVAFYPEQIKSATNQNPTDSRDIRYSLDDGDAVLRRYDYDTLIKKPDMKVAVIEDISVPKTREGIRDLAIENARKQGNALNNGEQIFLYNKDSDKNLLFNKSSVSHSLYRKYDLNAVAAINAADIIENSIVINEFNKGRKNADGSYVLLGMVQGKSGEQYIVRSIVNEYEINSLDVIYAMNTKKNPSHITASESSKVALSNTDPTISITELLRIVKNVFPDVLSTDVRKHFGIDSKKMDGLKYSIDGTSDAMSGMDFESDSEAKKVGYRFFDNTFQNTPVFDEAVKEIERSYEHERTRTSEKENIAEARRRLKENGWHKEINTVLNKSSVDGADTDVAMAIISQLNNYATDSAEFGRIMKFAEDYAEKTVESGQFIQSLAKYTRTPEGKTQKAMRDIKREEKRLQETNPKEWNEVEKKSAKAKAAVKSAQEEAAGEAVDEVVQNISKEVAEKIVNNKRKGKAKKSAHDDLTDAEKLANKIKGQVNKSFAKDEDTVDNARLQKDIINELYRLAKESPLPDKAIEVQKKDYVKIMRDILHNQEKYADIWDEAKEIVAKKYKGDAEKMAALEDYFDNYTVPIYSEESMRIAVKGAMDDLKLDVQNILTANKADKAKAQEKIKTLLGEKLGFEELDAETVDVVSNDIVNTFEKMLQKKAQKKLQAFLKEEVKDVKKRDAIEKQMMRMVRGGYFSEDEVVRIVRKAFDVPSLTTEEVQEILSHYKMADNYAEGSYERRKWEAKAQKIIMDKVPKTLAEKNKTARRVAMLLNPGTWWRNIDGNIIFGAAEMMKNVPAGLADMVVSKVTGKRTTSANVAADVGAYAKGVMRGAQEWWQDIQSGVDTSHSAVREEYQTGGKVFSEKHLYGRLYNKADTVVAKALQLGDRPFYEGAYEQRINEMKRLGYDVKSENVQAEAKIYALERVYQNDSKLSRALTNVRNELGLFGHFLIPFTQTPGNLLDKCIDYSGAGGLARALVQIGQAKNTGVFDQKLFVDRIGRALTGLGTMAFGAFLYANGWLTGTDDDDYKVSGAERLAGKKEYALHIGDKYYTIDWAQPVSAVLIAGAEARKAGIEADDWQQMAIASGEGVINTLFAMSCLEGLENMMSSYGNAEPADKIAEVMISGVGQYFPTTIRRLNNVIDPYQRQTYDPNPLIKQGKYILSGVPGASYLLAPKYTLEGEVQMKSQGRSIGSRVYENFLVPYNKTKEYHSEVNDELLRIYEKTGAKSQFLHYAQKKLDYGDGGKYVLEPEDYNRMQKEIGQNVAKADKELMHSSVYKSMSDDDKAEALGVIATYYDNKFKEEYAKKNKIDFTNTNYEGLKKKLADAGSWANYFAIKNAFPESNYEAAKKRKDKCDKYGIDYTAYAESTDEIKALREANSERFKKIEESGQKVNKTESNKRAIAKYLASRKDLTDPQRQVIWQEYYNGKTSETYKSVARRYGF